MPWDVLGHTRASKTTIYPGSSVGKVAFFSAFRVVILGPKRFKAFKKSFNLQIPWNATSDFLNLDNLCSTFTICML